MRNIAIITLLIIGIFVIGTTIGKRMQTPGGPVPADPSTQTAPTVSDAPAAPNIVASDNSLRKITSDYDRDLARFVGIKSGQNRLVAEEIISSYFGPDSELEGNVSTAIEREILPNGDVQFVVTRTGLPDDSVKSEQLWTIFSGLEGAATLTDYGMRIQCWRGDNPDTWQTELCP